MSERFGDDEAMIRVRAFLEQRATLRGLDADIVTAANHAPLLVSDLGRLLEHAEIRRGGLAWAFRKGAEHGRATTPTPPEPLPGERGGGR